MNEEQIARLDQIEQWLIEILDSPEFKKLPDYSPDLNLADACQAVSCLLNTLMESKQ